MANETDNKPVESTERIVRTTTTTSGGVSSPAGASSAASQARVPGRTTLSLSATESNNQAQSSAKEEGTNQAKANSLESGASNSNQSNQNNVSEAEVKNTEGNQTNAVENAQVETSTQDLSVRTNIVGGDRGNISEGNPMAIQGIGENTSNTQTTPAANSVAVNGQQTTRAGASNTNPSTETEKSSTQSNPATEATQPRNPMTAPEILQGLSNQVSEPTITPKPDVTFNFPDFPNENILLNQNNIDNGLVIKLKYNVQIDNQGITSINPYVNLRIELLDSNNKPVLTKDYVADTTTLQNGFQVYENSNAGFSPTELKNLPEGSYSIKFTTSNTAQPTVFEDSGASNPFTIDNVINKATVDTNTNLDSTPTGEPQKYIISTSDADVTKKGLFAITLDEQKDIAKIEVRVKDGNFQEIDKSKLSIDALKDLGLKAGDSKTLEVQLTDKAGNVSLEKFDVYVQAQSELPTISATLNDGNIIKDAYLNKDEFGKDITLSLSYDAYQDNPYIKSSNPFDEIKVNLVDKDGNIVATREFDTNTLGNTLTDNSGQYNFSATITLGTEELKNLTDDAGYKFTFEALRSDVPNDSWQSITASISPEFEVDTTIRVADVDASINPKVTADDTSKYIISTSDADVAKKGLFAITLDEQKDIAKIEIRVKDGNFQEIDKSKLSIDALKDLGLKAGESKTLEVQLTDKAGNVSTKDFAVYVQAESTSPQTLTINDVDTIKDTFLNQKEFNVDPNLGVITLNVSYKGYEPNLFINSANPYDVLKVSIMQGMTEVAYKIIPMQDAWLNQSTGTYTFNAIFKQSDLSGKLVENGQYSVEFHAQRSAVEGSTTWKSDTPAISIQDGNDIKDSAFAGAHQFTVDTVIQNALVDEDFNPVVAVTTNGITKDVYIINSNDDAGNQKDMFSVIPNNNQTDIAQVRIGTDMAGSYRVITPVDGKYQVNVHDAFGFKAGESGKIYVELTDQAGNTTNTFFEVYAQSDSAAPIVDVLNLNNLKDAYLNKEELNQGIELKLGYQAYQTGREDYPYDLVKVTLIDKNGEEVISKTYDINKLGLQGKDGYYTVDVSFSSAELSKLNDNKGLPETDGYKFVFSTQISKLDEPNTWHDSTSSISPFAPKDSFEVDETIKTAKVDTNINLDSTPTGEPQKYIISTSDADVTKKGLFAITLDEQKDIAKIEVRVKDGNFQEIDKSKLSIDALKDLGLKAGDSKTLEVQLTDKAGNVSLEKFDVYVQAQSELPTISATLNDGNILKDNYLNKDEFGKDITLSLSYQAYQDNTYIDSSNPFDKVQVNLVDKNNNVVATREIDTHTLGNALTDNEGLYSFNTTITLNEKELAKLTDIVI